MLKKIKEKIQMLSRLVIFIAIKIFGKENIYNKKVVEDIYAISSVNTKKDDVVKYYIKKVSICTLIAISSLILAISIYASNKMKSEIKDLKVERNDYGEVSKSINYEVSIPEWDKSKKIKISISSRKYTKKQFERIIKSNIKKFEKNLLSANKNFQEVQSDFKETGKFLDYPFSVSYFSDNSELISSNGKIKKKKINKGGEKYSFHFNITYENYKKNYVKTGYIYPRKLPKEEVTLNSLKREIRKIDKNNQDKKTVTLPDELAGKKLTWMKKTSSNSLLVFFIGIVIAILLFFIQDKKLHETVEQRKQQMITDYPELISTYVLFLGAGLSTKKVWEKIVNDKGGKKRWVYEEMKYTLNEMESGVSQKKAYEHFMERCNLREYTKFITLLLNNIEKGTRGLVEVLELEAADAYKERRNIAKLKGEEAGTKLLFPMAMMLVVVLIIVIVPAFVQMNA